MREFATFRELNDKFKIGYSYKHLLDMQRLGQFPRSVQMSPRRVAWDVAEIIEWQETRPRSAPGAPRVGATTPAAGRGR
jgi:predicted DNA-binding transcriptional regulator AlpA